MIRLDLVERYAHTVAIESKASGIDAFGCLYDDAWALTVDEWPLVCKRAADLYTTVKVPAHVAASWAQVNRDFSAEIRNEQRAFCGE